METTLQHPKATLILAVTLLFHQSIVLSQSTCPNADFSQSNFAYWQGSTGTYANPGAALGIVAGRHTIMSAPAIDPFTCGGLNVIPPGGTSSARLGNSNTGAEAEELTYTVSVTAQTALFIYKYAVVLENPAGHLPNEQPGFGVRILDVNGNPVGGNCGLYDVYGGQVGQNFQTCGGVTWLPWSTVGIDLTAYIGQNILVEFTTRDCLLSGHFGYAYIAAECAPMTLNLAYCAGDTQITLTAPLGFQQYEWNPGALSGQQITIPTPSLGTVYTCTMTSFSNQGNCQVILPMTIAPTIVTAEFAGLSGCESIGLNFTDQSIVNTGTITAWNWDFGDGNFSTNQNPNHSFTTSGSYMVELVATSVNGCLDTIEHEIDVYANPTVAFAVTGFCATEAIQFDNQTTDIYPLTYDWNFGDASANEQTEDVTHSYATAASYNVTLTATNSMGCIASVTTPTPVYGLPIVSAGPDVIICPGGMVTFSATGASTYAWDNGITNGVPFSPVITGIYTVIGTDVNGCSNTDDALVSFYNDPQVEAGLNAILCIGESTTVNASGATTYQWNQGISNGISFVPPLGTTIYTVVGTDLNGCNNTDSLQILVNPLPIVEAGNNQTICVNSFVTLIASGAVTYLWDNGISNGIPFQPTANGQYTVIGTDQNGCQALDMVTVSIEPPIVVNFNVNTAEGCAPLQVTFTNQSSGGSDCFWEFSDGTSGIGCGTITHLFEEPGCYDVSLTTTTALGCVSDTNLSSVVCVFANPHAEFQPSPIFMSELDPVTTMINNSTGAVSYDWDFGDGSISQLENPEHNYGEAISYYTIVLTAISEHGCIDTAEATVQVLEELIYYVPNTFTPDGDGFNEEFKPQFTSGFERDTYHLYIFDRWGNLVFESKDIEYGWNGSFAGEIAQDGTYTWKIEFKSLDRDELQLQALTGHVNILK